MNRALREKLRGYGLIVKRKGSIGEPIWGNNAPTEVHSKTDAIFNLCDQVDKLKGRVKGKDALIEGYRKDTLYIDSLKDRTDTASAHVGFAYAVVVCFVIHWTWVLWG